MNTRFIAMLLLIIATMTLTACSDAAQGTPSGVGTIVAQYSVDWSTATEFIPVGDKNTLCVTWYHGISCVKRDSN